MSLGDIDQFLHLLQAVGCSNASLFRVVLQSPAKTRGFVTAPFFSAALIKTGSTIFALGNKNKLGTKR